MESSVNSNQDDRPQCQYGVACYRRNPDHFAQFRHPDEHQHSKQIMKRSHSPLSTAASTDDKADDEQSTSKKQRAIAEDQKDQSSSTSESTGDGFGLYLSTVRGIKPEWNQPTLAKDIQGILSMDADKLVSSVQFNYMIDIPWLIDKYPSSTRRRPLLIITSARDSTDFQALRSIVTKLNETLGTTITLAQARLPTPFGTHHTKMMILKYETGLRIVIHTANLIEEDWDQKTQGICITPLLPKLDNASAERKEENSFKNDLIEYLNAYQLPALDTVVKELKTYDMDKVRVKLVGSVPGRFQGAQINKWGHGKLRALLKKYVSGNTVQNDWSVVAQFSSIGSLGPTADQWLMQEFRTSLTAPAGSDTAKKTQLHLIYPTVENVRTSLEGYSAGGLLPYQIDIAKKQTYLKKYLNQWRSECRGRTQASPHIKTYFRISSCLKKLGWFLLTSANLSKAAWGAYEKDGSQMMIRSYEVGVLFLPEAYGKEYFEVMEPGESVGSAAQSLHFGIPYDLPLVPYGSGDEPWVANISYKDKRDSHGRFWR